MYRGARAAGLCLALATTVGASDGVETYVYPGVSRYWSTCPGSRKVISGNVESGGRVILTARSEETTVGMRECNGLTCVLYLRRGRLTAPNSEAVEQQMLIYQHLSDDRSCTVAVEDDRMGRRELGCRYLDLVGPVRTGNVWYFSDSLHLFEPQLSTPLTVKFSNEILNTDGTRKVGSEVVTDCVHVRREAEVSPTQPITCGNGDASLVDTEITVDKWYCPGIGAAEERINELHWKRGSERVSCIEYVSLYRAVDWQSSPE